MNKKNISPIMFDISADIAGEIPIDIIQQWETSDKSTDTHNELLLPFTIKGTVVCSDASGVSRLTQSMNLIEVLRFVSEPKEAIYAYGSVINGDPIGIWFADNTQMFYDENIPIEDIVSQMILAQKEIKSMEVQVGISIHFGKFINIGNGLYGIDADMVEHSAEEYSSSGEIILSDSVKSMLSNIYTSSLYPKSIPNISIPFYTLDYANILHDFKGTDKNINYIYPIPFSSDFFMDIKKSDSKNLYDELYKKYTQEKIVILIKIHHVPKMLLLDQLSSFVLANNLIYHIDEASFNVDKVKSNGNLGIFISDDIDESIGFAKMLKIALSNNNFDVSIAISKGDVLIFDIPDYGKEISGNPVNVASKLAENSNDIGYIYIDSSIDIKDGIPYSMNISNIVLNGKKL